MEEAPNHKAGFVSIVGKPNVGKSTLINRLVGERLAIVTAKAQTTRHRILGIINEPSYQIIFSDTPGIIKPKYELHRSMMHMVDESFEDADVVLFMTDIHEKFDEEDVLDRLGKTQAPVILLINKVDQSNQQQVEDKIQYWQSHFQAADYIPISALHDFNIPKIFDLILERLPEHPPYYDKTSLTDKPEKFFAAEIIREKIFQYYEQEVPYSCEVEIEAFKENEEIIHMSAVIMVERDSQKSIVIGRKGSMLKKIGTEARKDLERFFMKKVHLEQFVKVVPNWRKEERLLKQFGYRQ